MDNTIHSCKNVSFVYRPINAVVTSVNSLERQFDLLSTILNHVNSAYTNCTKG